MKFVSVDSYADEVSDLLRAQLSVKGDTLERGLRKSGRSLPRHVRKDAEFIVQSQRLALNPKLAPRLDATRLSKAHKSCVTYLKSVDPYERRSNLMMSILGSVSLAIVGVSTLYIAFLLWRGFL